MLFRSILLILCFFGLLFCSSGNGFWDGRTVFFREIILRAGLSLLLLAAAVFCAVKLFPKLRPSHRFLLCLSLLLLWALSATGLLKAPLSDLAYLNHPQTVYLKILDFDFSVSGDGPNSCTMRGKDKNGNTRIFTLNQEYYQQGEQLWRREQRLYAKISCLPNTEQVLNLEYLKAPDSEISQSSGIHPIPPAGLFPGWSDKNDVLEIYGEPDRRSASGDAFTYILSGTGTGHFMYLHFGKDGTLNCVWVRNRDGIQPSA